MPAVSVADADGVQVMYAADSVLPAALCVPSVTVIVDPLITMVDAVPEAPNVMFEPVMLPFESTVPRFSWVVFVEFQIWIWSSEALLLMRTTTLVDEPFQPDRIDDADIDSLNVYVMVSFSSGLPAVPPAWFAAWTSIATGAVVSAEDPAPNVIESVGVFDAASLLLNVVRPFGLPAASFASLSSKP